MMQGDSYYIDIVVTDNATNEALTADELNKVEVAIGKTYIKEAEYDEEKNVWRAELTQQESFNLPPVAQQVQIRCKYNDGRVIGEDCGMIDIDKALSKEVL